MNIPLSNFHIHTVFSDGRFYPEEITRLLSERSYKAIGFSDHIFSIKPSLFYEYQIRNYRDKIEKIRIDYPKTMILIGGELDIQQWDIPFSPLLSYFDYLNIEYVNGFKDFKKIEQIRKVYQRPIYLVHTLFSTDKIPTITLFHLKESKIKRLLEELKLLSLGIELTDGTRNCHIDKEGIYSPGFNFYPTALLQKIEEALIPISIGTDMHDELEEATNISMALGMIAEYHLQGNYSLTLQPERYR